MEYNVFRLSETIKPSFFILAVFVFIMLLQGCASVQKEFRAYSANNSNWKMVENCGYQGCTPMVDYLTGKELTIRLEFDNNIQFFVIRTMFDSVKSQFEYNPSNITVKLSNGELLKPKAFMCSHTMWDLKYLRSSQSLLGNVSVNNSCYLLFFDHPQLAENDEAEMNLDEALTSSDKRVDVPLIYFRKYVGSK